MSNYDVIVVGAGAAGLMCAIEAGKRDRTVLVFDHASKPAEKIRISGGGRCNFTNLHTAPANFLSSNPHFCKSALSRYAPRDFIQLVDDAGIAWHEKTLGQLFCNESSQQIIDMLLHHLARVGGNIQLETDVSSVKQSADGFTLKANGKALECRSLVIATGGRSIPKMGASGYAYKLAKQFDLSIIEPRPGLVPLTFSDDMKAKWKSLSGVSIDVEVQNASAHFREAMLFTHRGLSGPAILQISSYWREGESIVINLMPRVDVLKLLKSEREAGPKRTLASVLGDKLPERLAVHIADELGSPGRMGELGNTALDTTMERLASWVVTPQGSEGYRTAEVTVGGIDTDALSSKTMEAKEVPGLFFIGECVDVTGHLGGFNFQWAWASGHAAGQVV